MKKHVVLLLIAWLTFAIYFYLKNNNAFLIFVLFSVLFGSLLLISYRSGNIILTMFMVFCFISQTINAPFFISNPSDYSYSGWSAVGAFTFKLKDFLEIYANLFFLIVLIVLFSIILDRLFISKNNCNMISKMEETGINSADKKITIITNTIGKFNYSLLLIGLIIVILVPLNIFMFSQQIGIQGIEQISLPFKLTGILFYFRAYIGPLLIFYLYLKSDRSKFIFILVLVYSLFAGISGISRGVFIMDAFSPLLIALIEKKYMRLMVGIIFILFGINVVNLARGLYYTNSLALSELIWSAFTTKDFNYADIVMPIKMLSGRLGGSQDIVLAYYYQLPNQIQAILNYFRGIPVFQNMALEVYDLDFNGQAFGVNFSILGWLTLLAQGKLFVSVLLAFIISCIIQMLEFFLIRRVAFVISPSIILAYTFSFIAVSVLYVTSIKDLYFILVISIIASIITSLCQNSR